MNRLSKPFDMTSVRRDNGDLSCDDIDSFRVNEILAGDFKTSINRHRYRR